MRADVLMWAVAFLASLAGCSAPACDIRGDQTAIGAAVLADGVRIGVLDAGPSRQSCGARVRVPKGDRRLTFVSVQGESVGVEFNSAYNTPLFVTFRGHNGKAEVYIGPE
jgi:hypothetical protein